MDGRTNGLADGWTSGQIDKLADGQTGGRTNGRTHKQTHKPVSGLQIAISSHLVSPSGLAYRWELLKGLISLGFRKEPTLHGRAPSPRWDLADTMARSIKFAYDY